METIAKKATAQSRLAQLETESQNIIENYLKQVATDANSLNLKNLQSKLKEVRSEQWQLFDKLAPRAEFLTRFSAAA